MKLTKKIRFKGWDEHQSYRKDRGTPPWIKVYRKIFTSHKWAVLTDEQKGQLVSMWIAAADDNGCLPAEPKIIMKIAQLDNGLTYLFLINGLNHMTTMTTTCQPNDAPERDRDRDRDNPYIPHGDCERV